MKIFVLFTIAILNVAPFSQAGSLGPTKKASSEKAVPIIYKDLNKISGAFFVAGATNFTLSKKNGCVLDVQNGDVGQIEITKVNLFSKNRYIKFFIKGDVAEIKICHFKGRYLTVIATNS